MISQIVRHLYLQADGSPSIEVTLLPRVKPATGEKRMITAPIAIVRFKLDLNRLLHWLALCLSKELIVCLIKQVSKSPPNAAAA